MNNIISKEYWWSKVTREIDAQNSEPFASKKLGWLRVIPIEPSESNQSQSEKSC